MAVDSSEVTIRVNVIDANSSAAVGAVSQHLTEMGVAGTRAGQQVDAGMKAISGHSLTALDNVRLLRDDLGIRIPRSMERAIAQSQILSTAIGSMGTGLIAIGAIDIGMRIAEGLKKGYDSWFSLTSAAQSYQEEVDKAKAKDFIDVHSVETAIARINQAQDAMTGLKNISDALADGSWAKLAQGDVAGFIQSRLGSKDYADASVAARKNADELRKKTPEYQQQQRVDQIEFNHALDGELRGRQKINAERLKRRDLDAAERQYSEAKDRQAGNLTPGTTGSELQHAKDAIAERQAEAETFNLEREHGQELARMRAEAAQAGLKGSALYAAQESAAIDELKNKDMDSVTARNLIHEKFHKQELARLRDEGIETAKIQRDAASAGLSGIAKTQAEGANRAADINSDVNLSPAARAARVEAAQAQTNAEMLQQEREFSQQIDSLSDQSAQHQISGFARIRAEAQKQLDDLQKKFDETYGRIDVYAPGGIESYAQGVGQLRRGQGAIGAGAGQQTADLARKNADETAQIEQQARVRSLSAEKQKTAAIELEYEDRVRKYREQLDEQEISQNDFNRRVEASQQEMNAEMAEAAKEARQKIAGEMSGLIGAHPLEGLQHMGEKFASQAGAALIQRASTHFGGGAGPESVMDRIAGVPGAGRGGAAGRYGATQASGMMTISHAEIQIGSASIAGGGGGGAGSSGGYGGGSSGGGYSGGGSTWMLGGSSPSFSRSGGGGGGDFGGSSAWTGGGGGAATSSPSFSRSGGGGGGGDFGGSSAWTGGGGASTSFGGGSSVSGTPVGAAPSPGLGFGGVVRDVGAGINTARGIAGMFGGSGGGGSAASVLAKAKLPSGLDTGAATGTDGGGSVSGGGSSAYSQSMLGGGMTMSNTLGAAGAGVGLFSASKQGGFGGMLGGASSGAQLGMEVGGPIGAAIGAIGGAALGFFGGGEQARVWWLKQGRPRLSNDMDSFQQGSMDYLSAYMDMESLKYSASETLKKMGFVGERYYHDTVTGEITSAEGKLSREQKAGRSASTFSAAQYDVGTDAVPRDGMAMIHENERIIPSDQNERITRAIEGGSKMAPAAQASDVNLHFHSFDAAGARDLLMQHSATVREALNASNGGYGGESDVSV